MAFVYLNIENVQGKYSIKDRKMTLLYKALTELAGLEVALVSQ